MHLTIKATLPFLLAALTALAATPASAREPADNAAPVYWQAISVFDEGLRRGDGPDLTKAGDPKASPDERTQAEQYVRSHQEEVAILLRAAALDETDFRVDREKGPDALLQHLGPMRQGARLLLADARLLLAAGDHAAAAQRLAGAFGIARHLAQDRFVISGLVSASIATAATEESRRALEMRALDKNDKAVLRKAVSRLDTEDPCGLRSGLGGERDGFVPWLKAHTDPKNREPVRALLAGMRDDPQKEVDRILALSKRDFEHAITQVDDYYAQALEAWEMPDARARLQRLQESLADGGFGLLGKAVGPALMKIRQRHDEVLDQLAQLRLWLNQ